MTAVFTAWASGEGLAVPLVFLSAIAIGCVVGAVNGFLVTRIGVSAFIATLGMGTVLSGGNLLLSDGNVLSRAFRPR